MSSSSDTDKALEEKPDDGTSPIDELKSDLQAVAANTYSATQLGDNSVEERASRVYGTKEQQAEKAARITGSSVGIEPFTSCLVASDQTK